MADSGDGMLEVPPEILRAGVGTIERTRFRSS
jgi:hypothetical protein